MMADSGAAVQAKMERIHKQVSLLQETRAGTIPLDRGLGLDLDFVDRPAAAAKTMYVVEITQKVRTYVPEAQVEAVEWQPAAPGELKPKVVFTSGDD